MENLFEVAFFSIEGDNVLYRGLDSGKRYGEYYCPLFDEGISAMVAGYLSYPNRRYIVENDRLYLVEGERKTEVKVYRVERKYYWDFSGWEWIKHEIKN